MLEADRARCVTHAGATVDVVRADHRAGELLEHIVVLVRRARRAEHPDRPRPVSLDDRPEPPRHDVDGLLPGRRRPRSAVAQQRGRDAIGGIDEPVAGTALDAEVPAVDRGVERRRRRGDPTVTGPDEQFAADAAVGARRAGPARGRPSRQLGTVLERSGRARVDAGAARDARAVRQRRPRVRHESRVGASPRHPPGELALDLVADADAAPTRDAARQVDTDRGVRVVDGRDVRGADRLVSQAIGVQQPVERLVRHVRQRARRVRAGEHAQQAAPMRVECQGVGLDGHAVTDGRRARRDGSGPAVHLHDAEPTGPRGRQPWVGAQGGHLDAVGGRGIEDGRGRPVRHHDGPTVDGHAKQRSSSG